MQENFRTQAFGFNKKDVMDYVYDLNMKKESLEAESGKQISELTEERDRLLSENEELNTLKKELEEELQKIRAEIADADIQKSRLYEEINENRRILLDNEREFNIKNEQISKLIAENEDYAQKCEKYAEISKDVGKTIMEAKRMATELVEKAQSEADEIRRETEKTVAGINAEISSANAEIDNFKRNFADFNRICESRVNTVEMNLAGVCEKVKSIADFEDKPNFEIKSEDEPNEKEFF